MSKRLVAILLAATSASVAAAADLPTEKGPPPPAPSYAAAFSWTGFYIGANAGAGFFNEKNSDSFAPNSIVGSGGTNGTVTFGGSGDTGFVGGAQIGYNWQMTPGNGFVLGVEGDLQGADLGRRGGSTTDYTFTPAPGAPPPFGLAFVPIPGFKTKIVRSSDQIDWFGTARGRSGYAFDRLLVYGTGGLAFGGAGDNVGFAAGGGVEYAFTDHISVKAEGLYVDLGSHGTQSATFDGVQTLYLQERVRQQFDVARVGLNYKF